MHLLVTLVTTELPEISPRWQAVDISTVLLAVPKCRIYIIHTKSQVLLKKKQPVTSDVLARQEWNCF